MTTTLTNRYPGTCFNCGVRVAAQKGIYHYGDTYCTEAHMEQTLSGHDARIDREQAELDERIRVHIIPPFIRDLELSDERIAELCKKASGGRKATVLSLESQELRDLLEELHTISRRRNRAAEVRQLKRDGKCVRCGGAGRSDRWALTGFVCYDCGGSGINQQEK